MKVIDFSDGACEKVQHLLDSYVDNQLSVETTQRLAGHLERCPRCTGEMNERLRLKEAVRRSVRSIAVPEDLETRVRRRLRDEASQSSKNAWRVWLTVAAVAVAGVVVVSVAVRRQAPVWETPAEEREIYIDSVCQRAGRLARLGFGDHLNCAHFHEYPSEPPSLAEVAETLGPDYEPLLNLVGEHLPAGFVVWMGHECSYQDRGFVHLALRREDELLSVLITRKQAGESFANEALAPIPSIADVPLHRESADKFELAGFETAAHLAFVVSNLPRERNIEFARALAPSLTAFLEGRQG